MVNPYDIERLEALIAKFSRLNLVLTPVVAVFLTMAISALAGGFSPMAVGICFAILCLVFDRLIFLFLQGVAVYMIALTPTEMEDDDEDETSSVKETTFTILRTSEGFIGKYKDVDYVEWIDLLDDEGKERHATFYGIADLSRDVVLDERCFVLPPGIIYQLTPI